MTQEEKVLAYMVKRRAEQTWFVPQDFMKPGQTGYYFVGYEASARLSGLNAKYPGLFETKPADKGQKKRRIKYETLNEWLPTLPSHLKHVFDGVEQTPQPDLLSLL